MRQTFTEELHQQLAVIRQAGLYRELRRVDSPQAPRIEIRGQRYLNFSSNDYLGLASAPLVKEAAIQAVEKFGAGSGASRLISGSLAPHHDLEETLAEFKGSEAALSFSSGYATAAAAIGAVLDRSDVIAIDELAHACIIDAARLCGAKLRVFDHNDPASLEKILKWANARNTAKTAATTGRRQRVLVVTESVFSMDGDVAPLREIVELKDKYGAWLMLDEAHATGLFGENRRGLAEAFELADRIEIQMGTLGKALGSSGGYICGQRVLIDLLINRARSFIFSTAPTPAAVAAAAAAVRLVQAAEGEKRRVMLWSLVDHLKNGLINGPWTIPVIRSAIFPLLVGEETRATLLSAALREAGIFIPAIRFPTVARGEARLRLTLTAAHTHEDASQLLSALSSLKSQI